MNNAQMNQVMNYNPIPTIYTVDSFVFNNFSLYNDNIRIRSSNHNDLGNVDYDSFAIPRNNGRGVLGYYLRDKNISFGLSVKGSDVDDLNERIHSIKKNCFKAEGLLQITEGNNVYTAKAVCTDITFNRQAHHINICPNATITFNVIEDFYLNGLQSVTENNVTANITIPVTHNGTIETMPSIYMTVDSSSSFSSIGIAVDGYTTTITDTFSAGDVLQLFGDTQSVQKNGTTINDYTGRLPRIQPGNNQIEFTFTATSLSVDLHILRKQTYA